ncbi:hypothetical protein ACFORG_20190 [Lutimaribacter marinistellae]|uniref:Ca2+-binding protein, RTX toxin-related n=1 Tax=Lutimaribacter marinistellae TaxID=1820329 RepID=A0ABV7TKA8_9RHOB
MPIIVSEDTTWNGLEEIVLQDDVQIAPGATLTILPGTTVVGDGREITVWGTLNAGRNGEELVKFAGVDLQFGNRNDQPGRIMLDSVVMTGGSFLDANGLARYGSFNVQNSIFDGVEGFYIWYPSGPSAFIGNSFKDSAGLSIGTRQEVLVENNAFLSPGSTFNGSATIVSWASYGASDHIKILENTFYSGQGVVLEVADGYSSAAIFADGNYVEDATGGDGEDFVLDSQDSLTRATDIDLGIPAVEPPSDTPVINRKPQGVVSINGAASEGRVLVVDASAITDSDGIGLFQYQWLRDGTLIDGATSDSYTLLQADVGAEISVRVSYTDGEGTDESVTSAATAVVGNVNDAPTGDVTIRGEALEGETLTADAATLADEDGLGSFSYEWLRDGVVIDGATTDSYTLAQSDVGSEISVRVSYTDGEGTDESVTSAATAVVGNVNDAPTGDVTISGEALEGETLTADAATLADEDGLGSFSYAWLRDGVGIDGAASDSYTLVQSDVGSDISVRVSYTDGQGTEEIVTSAATAAVEKVFFEFVPSGWETAVNTTKDGYQGVPKIAGLEGGAFVVVWEDYQITPASTLDEDARDIFGQKFDVNGKRLGGEFKINSFAAGDQERASVAGLEGGGFVVVWVSEPQGGSQVHGIYGQIYDAAGNPLGSEFLVPNRVGGYQSAPEVKGVPGGGFVVVWQSISSQSSAHGIFGRVFDATGEPLDTEFRATNWQRDPGQVNLVNPQLAVSPDGNFAVSWMWGITAHPIDADVFQRLYYPDGTPQTISVKVFDHKWYSNTTYTRDAAGLTSGGFVVANYDSTGDYPQGLRFAIYDEFGKRTAFRTNLDDGRRPADVEIAGLEEGGFLLISRLRDEAGVVARRFDNEGNSRPLWLDRADQESVAVNGETIMLADGSIFLVRTGSPIDGEGGTDVYLTRMIDASENETDRVLIGTDGIDRLLGHEGNDRIEGKEADDHIGGGNGNDSMFGNAGDDSLTGDDGEDTILGGSGDDTIDGGAGNDSIESGDGADTIILAAGGGNDTVTDFDIGMDSVQGAGFTIGTDGDDRQFSLPDGTTITLAGVPLNYAPKGTVLVMGVARVGGVLTANSTGLTDLDGLGALSYQWLKNGVAIDGATSDNYAPNLADVGDRISVTVSYTDGYGTEENVTSAATFEVESFNNPVSGSVLITGTPEEDRTLVTDTSGLSDTDGLGEFRYQWLRDGVAINSATSDAYTLKQSDVGSEIFVRVSYTDGYGAEESVISAGTAPVENVNDAPTGGVTVSGEAREGETLTADASALADEDGLGSFSYVWLRDGAAIDGATSDSYTLAQADVGSEISVRVSYSDGYGAEESVTSAETGPVDATPRSLMGTPEPDELVGGLANDTISGLAESDRLIGLDGNDIIDGGTGADTIHGGDGDDRITGGPDGHEVDQRDVIYAGAGDDLAEGGGGNDQIFGQGGNDTLSGGFGADELQGQEGDDVVTGGALSDLVFGGDGSDYVNGGFGYDRINGGDGADRFFHLGVADHGSDWVQDYEAVEGDVLVFGQAATLDQFQINFAHTATPDGERSGDDNVQEAFVIYRPTGQIMWALVDGEGQSSINLQIGTEMFDLLI